MSQPEAHAALHYDGKGGTMTLKEFNRRLMRDLKFNLVLIAWIFVLGTGSVAILFAADAIWRALR